MNEWKPRLRPSSSTRASAVLRFDQDRERFICSFCDADYSACTRLTFSCAGFVGDLLFFIYFLHSFSPNVAADIFAERNLVGFWIPPHQRRLRRGRMSSVLLRDLCSLFAVFIREICKTTTTKKLPLKMQPELINKPHRSEADKQLS